MLCVFAVGVLFSALKRRCALAVLAALACLVCDRHGGFQANRSPPTTKSSYIAPICWVSLCTTCTFGASSLATAVQTEFRNRSHQLLLRPERRLLFGTSHCRQESCENEAPSKLSVCHPCFPLKALILWMDEILHHLRSSGMMIPLHLPTNNGFPWSQSDAGFRPSTVLPSEYIFRRSSAFWEFCHNAMDLAWSPFC